MKKLTIMLLAAIAIAGGLFLATRDMQAADETTALDYLHGQPASWVQALRTTYGKIYLTVPVFDLDTPSNGSGAAGTGATFIGSGIVYVPVAGNVTALYSVLIISGDATMTTDTLLVAQIGTTEITGGTITILSGGTTGTRDSATPTANNAVSQGDYIEIESNGATAIAGVNAIVTIEIDRDD